MSDLEIYQGDDVSLKITVTEDGVSVDITDWTVYFTVKKHYEDPDSSAIFSKDITSHEDPIHGITYISLTSTETNTTPLGNYYYDIQIKDSASKIQTLTAGRFRVNPQVTRRKNGA
jgi:hypothetical protein